MESGVPPLRVRPMNEAPPRASGEFVLYWMTAFRRAGWNFALERAVERAKELRRPLLVLEALRCDHRWASDRFHRFATDGMRDNAARFAKAGVAYVPCVERSAGEGKALLDSLARRAALVVADDYPCFFLPRMVEAAGKRLPVLLEAVDSNGLLPLRASEREFPTAYAFRRFLQRNLRAHLERPPKPDPLLRLDLPPLRPLRIGRPQDPGMDLGALPIDHSVPPVERRGGAEAAKARLREFLEGGLPRYATERSQPDSDASSGLSPWLHWGHLSPHAVLHAVAKSEGWTADRLAEGASGKREGWWGMSAAAESFLDELVTWRELGFQFCAKRSDYDRFESLPLWARRTLEAHAGDPRPHLYPLRAFEEARTHDPLWNAAQRQLVREGTIHNYLRMLWGKKILEWSRSPEEALSILVELNNKYAVDGRDPNSYSGIFWTLGRFDRPWAPERPVFGVVRWMSSGNTARKLRVKGYLARHAEL